MKISAAAKKLNLSYQHAWNLIRIRKLILQSKIRQKVLKKIWDPITTNDFFERHKLKVNRQIIGNLKCLARYLLPSLGGVGGGLFLMVLINIGANAQTIKVAAAANLRFVFEEIKNTYEVANPGVNVMANFGSSGALMQQILNGANFDLYLSADEKYPIKLREYGAAEEKVETYALGKLVLWSNTVDVSKGLEVLTSSEVRRIAVAKPGLAPYGYCALECIKKAGLFELVKTKIVYADNIAQAAQFVQTGNAEVGFLAMSITFSPEMDGTIYVINQEIYEPIEQAMILVKENSAATKFMNYVLSSACQSIFEKFGYSVPSKLVMK